jgi:hypothetical protein
MGEPAANSAVAEVVATSGTTTPISFNGDGHLYAANLFLSLAFAVFGVAVFGRHAWALAVSIWHGRDKWLEPVSVSRIQWMCAGLALAMRAGVEAAELLAWSPHDPVTYARVIFAKRWILPASTIFTGVWMALGTLTWSAQEKQLRKAPLEVKIFARLPALKRPLYTVAISAVVAVGVVWTRG